MTTARTEFHRIMADRRQWPPGSADWEYRSRAARRLVWIIKGIPAEQWA
jgi:hypothetical protein